MENKTLEENLVRLEVIIKELENNDIPLEKAIELYQEATLVNKICETKINEARELLIKTVGENDDK